MPIKHNEKLKYYVYISSEGIEYKKYFYTNRNSEIKALSLAKKQCASVQIAKRHAQECWFNKPENEFYPLRELE